MGETDGLKSSYQEFGHAGQQPVRRESSVAQPKTPNAAGPSGDVVRWYGYCVRTGPKVPPYRRIMATWVGKQLRGKSSVRGRIVSTTEHLPVSDPQELRHHAEACLERAQSADNSNDQILFLRMAEAWHALAGQVEMIRTLSEQVQTNPDLVSEVTKADA